MTDDEEPILATEEPTEPWVTDAPGSARRVPGIDEVPETTYVEPQAAIQRRAILIGLAVGLGVTAIFAAIVLTADSGDSKKATLGPRVTVTSPSKTIASTTTTTSTPSTTIASTATTAAPANTATPPAAAPPPTPRATADPAAPTYQPVPLPAGVSGTLTACSWQQTSGGQYEAAGTLTNQPSTNHGWTITIHWLQAGREISQQGGVVDLVANQSKSWSLTKGAPNPPADPLSCALSVA